MEVVEQTLQRPSRRKRGFALILVLALTTSIMTIVSELLFQTEIIVRGNESLEHRRRAESTLWNGLMMAQYFMKLDYFLQEAMKSLGGQIPEEMIQSFLGGKKIYQMLNGIPLGREAFEQAESLGMGDLLKRLPQTLVEFLNTVDGYFVIDIQDISGKFNLNQGVLPARRELVEEALTRLFSLPEDARYLMNLGGFSARDLSRRILDYIDDNDVQGSESTGGGSEDSVYENVSLHRAKNAPFFSIEELRRIPPFHQDEIFSVFAPFFTVYPYPESTTTNKLPLMNVNLTDMITLSALLTEPGQLSFEDELEKFEDNRPPLKESRDLSSAFPKSRGNEISRQIQNELFGFESHTYWVSVKAFEKGISRQIQVVYTKNQEDTEKPFDIIWFELQ